MQDSWILFIDLVKAFDTVNRTAMIAILKKYGVPDNLAGLIAKLHTDVKVKLKVGSADACFNATLGSNRVIIWRRYFSSSTCKRR